MKPLLYCMAYEYNSKDNARDWISYHISLCEGLLKRSCFKKNEQPMKTYNIQFCENSMHLTPCWSLDMSDFCIHIDFID